MPSKKTKTEKRDFVAFVIDASKKGSVLGPAIIAELNKEGVKAKDLHQLLINWGYVDVHLADLTKLVNIFKGSGRIKDAMLETGY